MKLVSVFIIGLFISIPVLSAEKEKHDLFINGCQAYISSTILKTKPASDSDQLAIGYCIGLVDGVSKSIYYHNSNKVCFPEPEPTLNDLIKSVMSYVHQDPEKVKKLSFMGIYSVSDLVHISLMASYPCT